MKTKKELKEDYKQRKPRMGVYQIKNNLNNKILIGSSMDLGAFWNRQRFQLNNGLFHIPNLQQDWAETGEQNFKWEIIGEIEEDETQIIDYIKEVKLLHQMYLDEMQPYGERGYN